MGTKIDVFYSEEVPKGAKHILKRKENWAFSQVLERKIEDKLYTGDYLFLLDGGKTGYVYCECVTGREADIAYYELAPEIGPEDRYKITKDIDSDIYHFLKKRDLKIKGFLKLPYTNLLLKTRHGVKLVPVTFQSKNFEKIDPIYQSEQFTEWFNHNIVSVLQQINDKYSHTFNKPFVLYLPTNPIFSPFGTLVAEKDDIQIMLEFNSLVDYANKNEDVRGTIYHEILHHLKEIKETSLELEKFHKDELKNIKKSKSKLVKHWWSKNPKHVVANMLDDIVVNLSLMEIAPSDVVEEHRFSNLKDVEDGKKWFVDKIPEIQNDSSLNQFYFLTYPGFLPYTLTEAFGPIIFTMPDTASHESGVMKSVRSTIKLWEDAVINNLRPAAKELVLEFFNRFCNCLAHIDSVEEKKEKGLYETGYFYTPKHVIKHLLSFYVDAMKLLEKEGEIDDFDKRLKKIIEDRRYLKERGVETPKCKECGRTYPMNFKFCPACGIDIS